MLFLLIVLLAVPGGATFAERLGPGRTGLGLKAGRRPCA